MLTGEWRKYTHVGVAQLGANGERAQIAHSVRTRARKQKVAVQAAFLSVEPEFRLNERITLTLLRLLRAERLFTSVSFIHSGKKKNNQAFLQAVSEHVFSRLMRVSCT